MSQLEVLEIIATKDGITTKEIQEYKETSFDTNYSWIAKGLTKNRYVRKEYINKTIRWHITKEGIKFLEISGVKINTCCFGE